VGCDPLPPKRHGKEGVEELTRPRELQASDTTTWYRIWYRSQRTSPHLEGLKRGRNPASVLKWTLRNRPSKPVNRCSPSVGRFDSYAAPSEKGLHSAAFVALACSLRGQRTVDLVLDLVPVSARPSASHCISADRSGAEAGLLQKPVRRGRPTLGRFDSFHSVRPRVLRLRLRSPERRCPPTPRWPRQRRVRRRSATVRRGRQ
jgi:hypothetical protein